MKSAKTNSTPAIIAFGSSSSIGLPDISNMKNIRSHITVSVIEKICFTSQRRCLSRNGFPFLLFDRSIDRLERAVPVGDAENCDDDHGDGKKDLDSVLHCLYHSTLFGLRIFL